MGIQCFMVVIQYILLGGYSNTLFMVGFQCMAMMGIQWCSHGGNSMHWPWQVFSALFFVGYSVDYSRWIHLCYSWWVFSASAMVGRYSVLHSWWISYVLCIGGYITVVWF